MDFTRSRRICSITFPIFIITVSSSASLVLGQVPFSVPILTQHSSHDSYNNHPSANLNLNRTSRAQLFPPSTPDFSQISPQVQQELLLEAEAEEYFRTSHSPLKDLSASASGSSLSGVALPGYPGNQYNPLPGSGYYPPVSPIVGDPTFANNNLLQVPGSNSKSVSGDLCFDPLFTCDTPRTILYCVNARCTCPTGWTLAPGNIPLNTVWEPSSRRCVSLIGSGCHVSPSSIGNGYVYCQPGSRCIPHPGLRDVGTCGSSSLVIIPMLITFGLVLHYLI